MAPTLSSITQSSSDVEMTAAEMDRLKTYDSTLYGQINLSGADAANKRDLLTKGIQYLENEIVRSNKMCTPISPSVLSLLGHIHLLLEDFPRALSAYQRYYNSEKHSWQNPAFLYGLGIVYTHYGQHQWAIKSLQQIMYSHANFCRAGDVHFRLGMIHKNDSNFSQAMKHFRLAQNDSSTSSFLRHEVEFHIADMFDKQGDTNQARMLYEQLLQATNLPNVIRANALRQLGWMYHTNESLGNANYRDPMAIDYLRKSVDADQMNGETWYYLGRCYSKIGKVHDAFVAYRQSIDRSEASANTWCSIGILYQQQSQPMDALQAYICAVQLDKEHVDAWINLGVLYESGGQPKDALHCYNKAQAINSKKCGPDISNRLKILQSQLDQIPAHVLVEVIAQQQYALPCVDDAFKLQIPADLTRRQQGLTSDSTSPASQAKTTPKKRKRPSTSKAEAPVYLTQQELQMLHNLQAHQTSLTNMQMDLLNKLRQRYQKQQQHAAAQTKQEALETDQSDTMETSAAEEEKKERIPYPILPSYQNPQSTEPRKNVNRVNIAMSAKQILDACRDEGLSNVQGSPNINPRADGPPKRPSTPPPVMSPDQLTPPTPSVTIDNKKDALSPDLKKVCMAQQVVLLKGLCNTLRLNLGLFSTKTLVEVAPDHEVEVRSQRRFNVEETLDAQGRKTWKQESTRAKTTIAKYAHYQAQTFQESLREETGRANPNAKSTVKSASSANSSDSDNTEFGGIGRKQMIRFGTNIDLGDREKWREQLLELQKLPNWLRVHWAGNGLSHIGHTVLGMNSVQLYMKIPGCRTPGHQENLNFCAINLNIGPGDTEWFAVPNAYWGEVQKLCEKNKVDYLSGAWWPLPEDIQAAKIPMYRFTQKPGDLVWLSPGCVHWVQATGWCNNIAWNVAPMDAHMFNLAVERYEYNKLHNYKSIIPMVHMAWRIARNVKLTDPNLLHTLKFVLMKSLEHTGLVEDLVHSKNRMIIWHGRQEGEAPNYCFNCEVEVFNILFVREVERKHVVYCLDCALKISPCLDNLVILREYQTENLSFVYDSFELATNTNPELVTSISQFVPSTAQPSHS